MSISDFLTRWLDRIIMFLRSMVNLRSSNVQSSPVLTMLLLTEKCHGLIRSGKIEGKDGPKRLFFVEIDSKRIPADICCLPEKETIGLMVLTNKEGIPESVTEIMVWDAMDEDVAQALKEGHGAIEFVL